MYFAGLDAHLKYVSIAVVDRMGQVALETTVSTKEPERLLGALAPYRPLEVVVETCPFWPWLYANSRAGPSRSATRWPDSSR